MRYAALWYVIGALLLLAIIIGSLVPVPRIDAAPNDKLVHFLIYFLLMAWFGQLQSRRWWLVLGFVSLGLLLELIQGQTRYRTFEWLDVIANSAGVLAAWAVVMTPLGQILNRIDQWLQARQVNI